MSWMERLKNHKPPDTYATKPTKPPDGEEKTGFVGFVASIPGCLEKSGGGFVGFVASPPGILKKSEGATVDPVEQAANDGPPPAPAPALPPAPPAPAPDPDRACWPHSVAMNRAEIDRMVQRLALFEAQGMPLDEAEAEADRLMRLERTRSSPAPLSAVPPPATPPAPAKRTYALPDRELDRAYLRHHWSCAHCIAAGKRGGTRCAVGLTLNMVATGQTCHPHVGTGGGIS